MEPRVSGCEKVEFLFSPNPGEIPRPLGRIASGGELSRLMLAIKQVRAQGGRMVLAALQPLVLEVFTISRFDMLFEIFPDRAGALAAVGGAS